MPLLISVQTPHGRHLKRWGGKCMAESKTAQMMRLAREFHATEEAETGAVQTVTKVGRPPGKRSNPNFERLTVLVRKQTRKAAERLWEDMEPDKDMSELVERLLADWVKQHTNNGHMEYRN